ncbi:hypothetical protein [Caenimonas aquaedulcis]|uniref:Uncharacterized protein n=1 Tax=Caenimonas aquaedulcis TaxID=2793270 RepID=A0A931H1X5_9BURK|nr:hypothetical protein [Caenimonas aquaedulcis]MBG9387025.1 hypothetical protein [Caenimonas aquaedulcis]
MPYLRRGTSPSRAKRGDAPMRSPPPRSDSADNSASELIESPRTKKRDPLDAHDFADGGGGGGASAFSREKVKGP